jgi:NADPH-dependent 2,4-dienoyl-CoA reductase/sulfur reductase-like enzyme
MTRCDVAVIGGGPAGLAAALAARREGAEKVLIIERDTELGGILQQCIHNGFGLHWFGEELTGPEYAERFIGKLDGSGIEVLLDTMVLEMDAARHIKAVGRESGLVDIEAGAVVLAMGCRERTRGAIGIPGFRPAGVYTAGSAQRLVNMQNQMPGRSIVVLGSGDIGLIMARRLTWEGADVKLVCEIMPYSSGLARNIAQCLADNGIPLLYNHTVVKIHGRERVEGVTIAEVGVNMRPIKSTERFVGCDTLLLSVGLIPENELSAMAGVEMDPMTQGAVADQHRQTTVPGIFACGNVLHVHDLVDNVSLEADIAGRAAARYAMGGFAQPDYIRVKPGIGVRYVVPQRLDLNSQPPEGLKLFYRVRGVMKPAACAVSSGGRDIKRRRKPIMTPGEMEEIELSSAQLKEIDGDIEVSVQGG